MYRCSEASLGRSEGSRPAKSFDGPRPAGRPDGARSAGRSEGRRSEGPEALPAFRLPSRPEASAGAPPPRESACMPQVSSREGVECSDVQDSDQDKTRTKMMPQKRQTRSQSPLPHAGRAPRIASLADVPSKRRRPKIRSSRASFSRAPSAHPRRTRAAGGRKTAIAQSPRAARGRLAVGPPGRDAAQRSPRRRGGADVDSRDPRHPRAPLAAIVAGGFDASFGSRRRHLGRRRPSAT